MSKERKNIPRVRGCPSTRVLKIDATPEEVARQIFANAEPPEPSPQKSKTKQEK